ncbi:MAG: CHAT domain-containing protein [Saprospiraceae bacterium]
MKAIIRLLLPGIILFILFAFQRTDLPSINLSEISELLTEKEVFKSKEQYDLAINKILEIKDVYIQHKHWTEAVNCYAEIASLADMLSDFESKKKYALIGKNLIDKHTSINDTSRANIMQQLGEAYYAFETLDSAILVLKEVLTLYDNQENWVDKGWATYIIAIAYFDKEDYKNTEKYLLETEKISNTYNLQEEFLTTIEESFGILYFQTMGDFEKAIATTNKALEYRLSKPQKDMLDSLLILDNYSNLAIFYEDKGEYKRASLFYKQSVEFAKKLNQNPIENLLKYARNLNIELKNKLAIEVLKETLEINKYQPKGKIQEANYASICLGLSKNYDKLGQVDSTMYFINQYSTSYNNSKDFFEKLDAVGIYINLEKLDLALLELNQIKLSEDNETEASLNIKIKKFRFLGKIYAKKNNYSKALEYYEKALITNARDFYTNPDEPEIRNTMHLIYTLKEKALVLKAMNTEESLKTAFETNQLAIKWAEKMRQSFVFESAKVILNKNTSELYKNAIDIAYQLHKTTKNQTYVDETFIIAEKQKGILLLESLIDDKGKEHYKVPKHLLKREKELKSDIAFYKQKMLETQQNKETGKYELYENYHTTNNLEFAKLKDSLKTYYKSYFDLEYQTSIATVDKVQDELLTSEQAFVQFVKVDSAFYVFVIEADKKQFLKLSTNEVDVENLQQFQTMLQSSEVTQKDGLKNFERFTTLAYQNYQQFFEPIKNQLSSTISELIIVPDDVLNYLPFETLLGQSITTTNVDFLRLPYLIRDYQFHYGYSGTLLLENKSKSNTLKSNDKVLAYAPLYKGKQEVFAQRGGMETLRNGTVQLKGTAKEIQAIANYFDGTFNFSKTATKENFQKEVSDYGILHLAMHGKPSLKEPDYAHLVFSNVDNDSTNLLHHYEITALETNAQLAVLSACETGVGKMLEGEGVMSLGKGFMYAGVPSVVMSLWKMNDQSTSELMPLFYEKLAKGMRKDKALHQAKIDYLDNSTAARAFPFYWAGFVSLGDTQPIKKAGFFDTGWWWEGGILLLLTCLFSIFIWWRRD